MAKDYIKQREKSMERPAMFKMKKFLRVEPRTNTHAKAKRGKSKN